jgi:hypothetical protein
MEPTPVLMSTEWVSTRHRQFAFAHLPDPHLTHSPARLFRAAHHEPPFTAAAHGALKPPPQGGSGGPTSITRTAPHPARPTISIPTPPSTFVFASSTRITRHHRYYRTIRPPAPHRYSAPHSFRCLGSSLSPVPPTRDRPYRGEAFPRFALEPKPSSRHLHAGHHQSSKQVSL